MSINDSAIIQTVKCWLPMVDYWVITSEIHGRWKGTEASFSLSFFSYPLPIIIVLFLSSNWLPYIIPARITQHRKLMLHVRMRVYWLAAHHWTWRGSHSKHHSCYPLQPLGTDHSKKHRLSFIVWRHRLRENVFSVRCITTVRARTTEKTSPVLLAACVLRALPSNGSVRHSINIWPDSQNLLLISNIPILTGVCGAPNDCRQAQYRPTSA
jgi:hypothetical protein